MMKFYKDEKKGKAGERAIVEHYKRRGCACKWNTDNDYKYDFELTKPDGTSVRVEVKTDQYELKMKTNNMAIEVFCKRRKKQTGAMSTLAEYFIYFFPIEGVMYIIKSERLRQLIRESQSMPRNCGIRRTEGGDNKDAVLYLIDRDKWAHEFKIVRIDAGLHP